MCVLSEVNSSGWRIIHEYDRQNHRLSPFQDNSKNQLGFYCHCHYLIFQSGFRNHLILKDDCWWLAHPLWYLVVHCSFCTCVVFSQNTVHKCLCCWIVNNETLYRFKKVTFINNCLEIETSPLLHQGKHKYRLWYQKNEMLWFTNGII